MSVGLRESVRETMRKREGERVLRAVQVRRENVLHVYRKTVKYVCVYVCRCVSVCVCMCKCVSVLL